MTFDLNCFFANRSRILIFRWEGWVQNSKLRVAHFCSNVFSPSDVQCSVCHWWSVGGASRRLGSKKLARKTSPAVLQVEVCWPLPVSHQQTTLQYIDLHCILPVYYLFITYMYHQYISPTVIYWSTYNVQCSVHNVHITYTYITSSSAGGPWQFLHYINLWNDILQGRLLVKVHLAIYRPLYQI